MPHRLRNPLLVICLGLVAAPAAGAGLDLECRGCFRAGQAAQASHAAPASVEARLAELEARLARLEGAPYGAASLHGHYRCLELAVGSFQDKAAAGVAYDAAYHDFTADGLGRLAIRGGGSEVDRAFRLERGSGRLAGGETVLPWSDQRELDYLVAADGRLDFPGAPEYQGWVSRDGNTAILRYVDDDAEDGDRFRGLTVCLRTGS